MSEFLLTLLSFFLSLGVVFAPVTLPSIAQDNFDSNLTEIEASVADPVLNFQAEDLSQENSVTTSNHEEYHEGPNTEKQNVYNTKSEREVGEVAGVAIEKAPPLISCDDLDGNCSNEGSEPESPPIPAPVEPQPDPDPEPPVEPIEPPITIDPPVPPYPCGSVTNPKPPYPLVYTCLPVN